MSLMLQKVSDLEVVAASMEVLGKIFPTTCPNAPTGYSITRWGTDIFSMGSYSFMPRGMFPLPADEGRTGDLVLPCGHC